MQLPVAREKDAWGGRCRNYKKGVMLKKHNGECGLARCGLKSEKRGDHGSHKGKT
jgi:hypothetical protein